MGIFSFLKTAGASVLGKGNDEKEITDMLNKEFPGKIQDLKVKVSGGVVELEGKCDTLATKEKAILLAGNIQGIEEVVGNYLNVIRKKRETPDTPAKPIKTETDTSEPVSETVASTGETVVEPEAPAGDPASEDIVESRFYEIKAGDTLSKIAKEFYGNANKYPQIFEANREVIKDPDKIYPGQMIRIPELS